jgi:transcriptional regulator with XRE-family HTH domain
LTEFACWVKLGDYFLMGAVKPNWHQVYHMVGERIRAERKRRNITQGELAENVGLTRASITNVERGTQKLLLHTLVDIADYLGTSPARLLPTEARKLSVQLPNKYSREIRNWVIHSIGAAKEAAQKR